MYEEISDVTILTIIISTFLLLFLGSIVIYFLLIYQRKVHRHQEELLLLRETFNKTLLQSQLEIKEHTLHHISTELHSNISQIVAVINMNLSSYFQSSPRDESILRETKTLVKQLATEVKSLTTTLNSDHVGKAGFLKMMRTEIERLERAHVYKVHLNISGSEFRLNPEKEIILFRLCQEILNNIIKHADGSVIEIFLEFETNALIISIKDNGKGFDLEETSLRAIETGSTGINNIYSRTTQMEGEVVIYTSPGNGAEIKVKIPKST